MRFSCPYTSEQNGKFERMIRTINNTFRTLLFQARLPPPFWTEALLFQAHLPHQYHTNHHSEKYISISKVVSKKAQLFSHSGFWESLSSSHPYRS